MHVDRADQVGRVDGLRVRGAAGVGGVVAGALRREVVGAQRGAVLPRGGRALERHGDGHVVLGGRLEVGGVAPHLAARRDGDVGLPVETDGVGVALDGRPAAAQADGGAADLQGRRAEGVLDADADAVPALAEMRDGADGLVAQRVRRRVLLGLGPGGEPGVAVALSGSGLGGVRGGGEAAAREGEDGGCDGRERTKSGHVHNLLPVNGSLDGAVLRTRKGPGTDPFPASCQPPTSALNDT